MSAANPSSRECESWFRLCYCKDAELRFLGHRDTMQLLLRLFRRARLPVSLTKGFSPHPRVVWGPPLPLGFISEVEALDLALRLEPQEAPMPVAERSLGSLREAQQDREVVLDLRPLEKEESRISRAASARYALVFVDDDLNRPLTGDRVQALLADEGRDFTTPRRNTAASSAAASNARGGLLSWEVEDGVLLFHASVSGDRAFPLSRFVKRLAAHTGLHFLIGERTELLDAEGQPIS